MQKANEGALLLSKVIQTYYDIEKKHGFQNLNARQLGIVYNNLTSLNYISLESSRKGVRDLGLQRQVYIEMERDDIIFAMRDDEVAIKVFGRDFFSK
jgi:hypothetical protein